MPIDRPTLLRLTLQLGREFAKRKMFGEADQLRTYYLCLRHRRDHHGVVDLHWDPDQVVEWMGLLRLPPYQSTYKLGNPYVCPNCTIQQVLAVRSLPDGHQLYCPNCQAEWWAPKPKEDFGRR